jgi:ubiquitin carboxyl-terminal hydrolase 5/13
MYSFQNIDSPEGIYVDLNSWMSFSPAYAQQNYLKTKNPLYLRIKRSPAPRVEEEKKETPTVLGVGIEGGFDDGSNAKYLWEYAITIFPSMEVIPYDPLNPNSEIPISLQQAIKALIEVDSAEKKEEVKAFNASDFKFESELARNLVQLDNKRVVPENYTCDVCGGGATTNLWLNLTDGHVGCGRRNVDGSGGNGHAMDHYKETQYPIVVKLGTITADLAEADVHDYVTDEEIIDPLLDQHLKHFGLDHKKLFKTDKTVAEMQLDLQFSFDWAKAEENDKVLVHLYGPGMTGLQNLGNTCYMASVMQVLFKIPEIADRYYGQMKEIFQNEREPADNFHVQMAKLGHGLLSGQYSQVTEEERENNTLCSIRPGMFKAFIGKGHSEFSTAKQQDALEFIQHILSMMERKERNQQVPNDPSEVFAFKIREKIQCKVSGASAYKEADEKALTLPIPIEMCTNQASYLAYQIAESMKTEEEKKLEKEKKVIIEPVRPIVPLQSCFEALFAQEAIENWFSPALKKMSVCLKDKRFLSFPKYLVLQMGRFTYENGASKKIDAFIDVPDDLDLEAYRALPKDANEMTLEEEEPVLVPDESVVSGLMGMGFGKNRAERAWYHTQGKGTEAAMDWVFSHMEDADIDTPFVITSTKKQSSSSTPNAQYESTAEMMMGMGLGFSRAWTLEALNNCGGDADRAVDWMFSHEEPQHNDVQKSEPSTKSDDKVANTSSKYTLFAFITHMGTSPQSGHYVAHIKHGDQWVIFNDSKVCESQDPPRKMAYVYIYRRV